MTVNEYRRKHKRCRTCKYASKVFGGTLYGWCEAKGHNFPKPLKTRSLMGCFCKIYEPKEYKDG